MAICNIEDKRARDRAKEKGLPANKRRAAGPPIDHHQLETSIEQLSPSTPNESTNTSKSNT